MRAKRMLGERPARLGHADLVARVTERQAQTPTARISAAVTSAPRRGAADGALCALILGSDGWRAARVAQGGGFSQAAADPTVSAVPARNGAATCHKPR